MSFSKKPRYLLIVCNDFVNIIALLCIQTKKCAWYNRIKTLLVKTLQHQNRTCETKHSREKNRKIPNEIVTFRLVFVLFKLIVLLKPPYPFTYTLQPSSPQILLALPTCAILGRMRCSFATSRNVSLNNCCG